ncbi:MAG: response regulator [Hyphomicrobiaceae bacterium]
MSIAKSLEVLVADDTTVSRALICETLSQLGIENVRIAKDGKAALDSMMTKPAHLVLSDYHMPVMDGLQLLEKLRSYKPTSQVGFILITANSDRALVEKGAALGMNNYIAKPFTTPKVKQAIERVVGTL